MLMFAQRRWLIWIAVVMVGLGPYVLGLLTNVGTADKPLELWRNLWSPERRWFWVAGVVIVLAVGWAEFKLSHKNKISSQQEAAESKKTLSHRVSNQINWIFQDLLYSRKQLVLNLEECPDLVQPRYRENHIPMTLARKSLPPGKVIEHWDAHSQLLLVGQPRAGKSTMLRELARDLIERGDLPVVMQLPAWERYCKKIRPFSASLFLQWLIDELQQCYGIKPEISQKWLDESELILLLDGLDEVSDGWRDRCVQSINQFTEDTITKMVVCSQLEADEARPRLHFDHAFRIQPLTVDQVLEAGQALPEILQAYEADPRLHELATTPWGLSVIALACRNMTPQELGNLIQSDRWEEKLWSQYIDRSFVQNCTLRYPKENPPYSAAQTKKWLHWLAQKMQADSQSVFLIENLQSKLLKNQLQNWCYQLIKFGFMTLINVLSGIMFWMSLLLMMRLFFASLRPLTIDPIITVAFQDSSERLLHKLDVFFNLSISNLFNSKNSFLTTGTLSLLIASLYLGLFWGVLYGSIQTFLTDKNKRISTFAEEIETIIKKKVFSGSDCRSYVFLFFSAILMILILPILLFSPENPPFHFVSIKVFFSSVLILTNIFFVMPIGDVAMLKLILHRIRIPRDKSFWSYAKYFIAIGLFGALNNGLFIGICGWLTYGFNSALGDALIGGISSGIVYVRLYGAEFYLRHLPLRLMLYLSGYIPWNYGKFLDYADKLRFLNKDNGAYAFINPSLQEYFAEMNTSNSTD